MTVSKQSAPRTPLRNFQVSDGNSNVLFQPVPIFDLNPFYFLLDRPPNFCRPTLELLQLKLY